MDSERRQREKSREDHTYAFEGPETEPRRLTIAGKRETKKEEKKGKSVYAEECPTRSFGSWTR